MDALTPSICSTTAATQTSRHIDDECGKFKKCLCWMDSKLTTDLKLGRGRNLRFWILERPRVFYPSHTLFLVYVYWHISWIYDTYYTPKIATLGQCSNPDPSFFLRSKCGFIQSFKSSGYYLYLNVKNKRVIFLYSVFVMYVFQAVETKDHTGASVLVQYIEKIRKRKLYNVQTCIHLSEIPYLK